MKYWEIIADNLKKGRMELGLRLSFGGLRGANDLGLWMHTVTMESVSLCVPMKY
jgi:hypothetical protein